MAFSVGDAFVTIRPDFSSGFERQLTAGMASAISGVTSSVDQLGRKLTRRLTVPIAVGVAANLTQFQALDAKIRETTTLFAAGGDRADAFLSEFREGVAGVADDIGVFEQTINDGLYDAISAGVPRDNVFEFLDTASKAAVGGALDIQTAVGGLTTAVNAFFEGDFSRAGEAADILFRGVARGKTTFEELSTEMATAAPLANTAGVAFEEFVAVLATMTLSGTNTSEAVTNVRAAITGLLRPSEELTAIFQEAGFQTQDAAVKALGLQGALQLVTEAVDNEVGALIKLLGGAEAANAALQVTGDNAETFESVLRDTSNATGALNSAFDLMADGVGKTFQRMFVQFDRLGSSLGEIVATVAVPIVKAFTSFLELINGVVDRIRQAPATVRVFATSVLFLTAALGPLLFILARLGGFFIPALANSMLSSLGPMRALALAARGIVGVAAIMTSRVLSMIPAFGGAASAMRSFGTRAAKPLISTLRGVAGRFIGIGVAIGAAALAFELIKNRAEDIRESARFATDQVAKLADNLGLVVKPATELEALDGASISFALENPQILTALSDAIELGILEDRLVQIGYQLIAFGNTPEEAFNAIQQLASALRITLPIGFDVEDLTLGNFAASIVTEAEILASDVAEVLSGEELQGGAATLLRVWIETFGLLDQETQQVRGRLEQIGEQIGQAFRDSPQEGIALLEDVNAILGDNAVAADLLNDAFLRSLDPSGDLALNLQGLTTGEDAIKEITGVLPTFIGGLTDAELSARNSIRAIEEGFGDRIPGDIRFTEEETQLLGQAFEGLNATVDEVVAGIQGRFTEIRDTMIADIPLWGEYGGAAELSVTDILHSLDHYNEAILAWSNLNRELAGEIPDDLRAKLNEMPLAQREALAKLAEESPTEFQKVIDGYEESFDLTEQAAFDTWQVELPKLIEDGNEVIANKARELESDFGEIGTNVATAWRDSFSRVAATWTSRVTRYAAEARRAAQVEFNIRSPSRVFMTIGEQVGEGFALGLEETIPRVESVMRSLSDAGSANLTTKFDGRLPARQPAQQSGGVRDVNFNLEVNNPSTKDLDRDLSRFRGVMETNALFMTGRVK